MAERMKIALVSALSFSKAMRIESFAITKIVVNDPLGLLIADLLMLKLNIYYLRIIGFFLISIINEKELIILKQVRLTVAISKDNRKRCSKSLLINDYSFTSVIIQL